MEHATHSLIPVISLLLAGIVGAAIMKFLRVTPILGYFIAGIVKISKSSWRTGRALSAFVRSSNYEQADWLLWIFNTSAFSLIFSWGAMLAECFFPLVFLSPEICLVFVTAAFVFHLVFPKS